MTNNTNTNMPETTLPAWQCNRCWHIWPKQKNGEEYPLPKVCPKCKSPYWNTPRKHKIKE